MIGGFSNNGQAEGSKVAIRSTCKSFILIYNVLNTRWDGLDNYRKLPKSQNHTQNNETP
jgi:hypothetical protein